MPIKRKISVGKSKSSSTDFQVTESVGNYEKHPFFIEKANKAKALLAKVGLPQPLLKTKS